MNWAKIGLFVGGMAASTIGVKILTSKTAKKVYTHVTAAVIRGKDCVMENVTKVREWCGDILTDAKEINEDIAAKAENEEIIEDTAEEKEEAESDEV